jgi:hypothetical protein
MNIARRAFPILLLAVWTSSSAHAAKMQVCVNSSGQILAKSKCKAGESVLTLNELTSRLQVSPAQTQSTAPAQSTIVNKGLTPADVNGLIAAYLACYERNKTGQARHDTINAYLADIGSYAAGLLSKNPVSASGTTLATLSSAQQAFYALVDRVNAGDYSALPDVQSQAADYLSQAIGAYASSMSFQNIRKSVQAALYSISTIDIGDFQPEVCGQ